MSNPDQLNGQVAFAVSERFDGRTILQVTPLDYFQKRRCQADWTPGEVFAAIEELGYQNADEMMESIIEFPKATNQEELIQKLISHPLFIHDPSFVKYVKKYDNESGFKTIY